jgi:glutamate formiminotransferase
VIKHSLCAVPNISEGRRTDVISRVAGENHVLDVHSDVDHNRSILTYGAAPEELFDAVYGMIERAVAELDIGPHSGAHPRFGVVDVLPFVTDEADPVELRERIAELRWRIDQGPGVPSFTYGLASDDRRALPDLRRELRANPPVSHPTAGVICIGIRDTLIAFNVNCLGPLDAARAAAAELRQHPGIRALGLALPSRGEVQLSMNLFELRTTGPARAFETAIAAARDHGLQIIDAEVAGLVPASTLGEFKRLPLRWPVRTIEDAVRRDTITP